MKRYFAIFISFLLGLFFTISIAGCDQSESVLTEQLIGVWENSDGYQIIFNQSGSGYFPGVEKVPGANFSYIVKEGNILEIDLQGQVYQIEIEIDGDLLVWKDQMGQVIYRRLDNAAPKNPDG